MSSAEAEADKMGRKGGFEKARDERDALRIQVVQLQRDAEKYQKSIAEREHDNETLEAKLKSLEEAVKSDNNTTAERHNNDEILEAKVAELQQEALLYHNTIAERETQNEALEARIKSLEERFKSENKTLKETTASSAKEATEADGRAREANKELQKLKEQLEVKDEQIQEFKVIVTDMYTDQNNKETERRQLQALLNDAEARLRGSEENSMRLEEELEELRKVMTLVKDRLGQLLTNWGQDITSDNVLAYIDQIEESRLPKASSQVSLSTAFENGARAKGGDRKISMSDELARAAESMDDDRGEDEPVETNGYGQYIEELEKQNTALLEENANLKADMKALMEKVKTLEANLEAVELNNEWTRAYVEKLQKENEELQKGTTSLQVGTPATATATTTAEETITKIVEKPVERPATLSYYLFKAPWYVKLLLLVLAIGYVWNNYSTWTERRMWLDANEKPWLSSEIYHGYMARQSESIFPLFTIESGPWVEWIEYEVLGYLRVMPG
ncbi:hypothetical protein PRZ48_006434 [Zasmidium cellare]|uniref:Uncharacterized protein n=1 Tax=Zasmidium cellare TaxID=395010 RepID=A0ABR0ENC7_ZASCE|nr:hypothetical protein PRZ48_006434 [Zasmidium cellare]